MRATTISTCPTSSSTKKGALAENEVTQLEGMGHKLELGSRAWGNMQVITWDYASGKVQAAADPRGEGEGLVY